MIKKKKIERLKLTKEEYQLLKSEIENLEKKLSKFNKNVGQINIKGDYIEEMADLANDITILKNTISRNKQILGNAIIIERKYDDDQVDVGDIVKLTLGNNSNEMKVMLSGKGFDNQDGVISISLNSPIGSAIYGKKVGETYLTTTGESQTISGEILDIQKYNSKVNDSVQKTLK